VQRWTLQTTTEELAAQEGHIDAVVELIRLGAKVDLVDNKGATPLFVASQEGHTEIVKELVRAGEVGFGR
jgi:ankyrin repeat protein